MSTLHRLFAFVVVSSIAAAGCGKRPATSPQLPYASDTQPDPNFSKPAPGAPDGPGAKITPVQGDAPESDTSRWVGTWMMTNTAGKTHTTIAIRGGVPTVVRAAESVGDMEVFEIRGSRWKSGTLEWSYYVPSTQYLVTYTCDGIEGNQLQCRWRNDHGMSGTATLPRVGGGGATPPPATADLRMWEGLWLDPDTAMKTQMTIAIRNGVPTHLRSAESTGDREVYELRGSQFAGGRLRFSHFVPSTRYLVTYTCSTPRGSSMSCSWSNDHNASGNVVLERVGGAGNVPPPPPPSGDPSSGAFIGVWQDPNTAYKARMTIAMRNGNPTVIRSAESTGDMEVYEVRSSTFSGGTLRWSHYVPSTQYLVTYSCTAVRGDSMICTWSNDHNRSGSAQLERVGGGGGAAPPPPPPPPPPPSGTGLPPIPNPKDDFKN